MYLPAIGVFTIADLISREAGYDVQCVMRLCLSKSQGKRRIRLLAVLLTVLRLTSDTLDCLMDILALALYREKGDKMVVACLFQTEKRIQIQPIKL
jgi:hypothetical protein